MIQVTVGTNTQRNKITVDPDTTLRQVLEEQEVNYAVANVHLDGSALKPGDLDKSFTDLGITDSCYLIAVIKADNA
jgi:hypothetical protein